MYGCSPHKQLQVGANFLFKAGPPGSAARRGRAAEAFGGERERGRRRSAGLGRPLAPERTHGARPGSSAASRAPRPGSHSPAGLGVSRIAGRDPGCSARRDRRGFRGPASAGNAAPPGRASASRSPGGPGQPFRFLPGGGGTGGRGRGPLRLLPAGGAPRASRPSPVAAARGAAGVPGGRAGSSRAGGLGPVLPPEGLPPEGLPPEGLPPEGLPPEGLPPEGLPPEGLPPEGLPPEGLPPEGLPPEGLPPEGLPPEGLPPEGLPPEGLPPEGLPPEGLPRRPRALSVRPRAGADRGRPRFSPGGARSAAPGARPAGVPEPPAGSGATAVPEKTALRCENFLVTLPAI
ncbi:basic proline-rich protein-like [Anser cygnoides]|uniref:basic proline-rich protein-like n=1 Tax=Anser cygnoides TaxID=8845 RepID=UPI0034D1C49D